ncbi:MAG: PIG-L family deacetylase [Tannerellaceae bacterium]|jgi:LmbE family N-acetylglucosaminyl deacetylase|nr:PIG-L family deacetylase [Tannerellaceae bacterium]
MKQISKAFIILILTAISSVSVHAEPVRVIMFGAHPDDCEFYAGGTAALFAQMGHKVKFVSLTNGNKGHHLLKPDEIVARRKKEMQEVARILNIEYDYIDNNDGELQPTVENRKKVIKMICDWKADIVITHRSNDYHPDHRNTAIIVQDAAYMIGVPLMVPDGTPLRKAPVFLYMADGFKKPAPFTPDIVVDITSVIRQKLDAICANESQVFEWLPWIDGYEASLPADKKEKRKFVDNLYQMEWKAEINFKEAALRWYSSGQVENSDYFEAFEICEYGKIPAGEEIKQLFPMLPR